MPPRRNGRQVVPRPPGARPGGAAPWDVDRPIRLTAVRAAFDALGPPGQLADGPVPGGVLPGATPARPAAVLVALFEEAGEARVVLTRRAAHLRSHTGEVAFPGGRLEPTEEPLAAALREAGEEVGLDPAVCDVVGELSPLSTMSSRAVITPFVAVLPGRPQLRPNPAEVEHAFDVALSDLAGAGVYREEWWPIPGLGERPVYFFELADDTVWGATARILRQLLDVVAGAPAPEPPGAGAGAGAGAGPGAGGGAVAGAEDRRP